MISMLTDGFTMQSKVGRGESFLPIPDEFNFEVKILYSRKFTSPILPLPNCYTLQQNHQVDG
jgi:hypothetical protein